MTIQKSILILIMMFQIVKCDGQFAESNSDLLPSIDNLISNAIISEGNQARLQTTFSKAQIGGKLVIGVLGGSITEGAACSNPEKRYANVVLAWWKKKFPKAEFELINAGIGATGPDYGAMRVKRDLLSKSPDIVIVDYAVNDSNTKDHAESYEGVVRQILNAPQRPALMLLFMMRKDGSNSQDMELKIGTHYDLPMISFRDAIWPEINAGSLKWEQISPDNVHPNENGHLLVGEMICGALEKAYKNFSPESTPVVSTTIPDPLISDSFEFTSLIDGEALIPITNHNWVFDGSQKRFAGWKSSEPGSELEFEITGKLIYLACWRIKGPMGKVSASVDGSTPIIVDSWFDQSWGGYRYMFQIGNNLTSGKHIVHIELLSEKNKQSTGNEFKILCLGSAGLKIGSSNEIIPH